MSLSLGKIHYTREASARAFPPPLRASRARKSVLAVEKNAKYRGEFAGIIHTGARGKMPRINRGRRNSLSLSLALSGITCSVWRVHAIFPYTRAAGHLQLPRRRPSGCTDEINLIASSTNKYPFISIFRFFFSFFSRNNRASMN